MRPYFYVLDEGGRAVPCNVHEWAEFFSHPALRRLRETFVDVVGQSEPVRVSTVFLGMDHNHRREGAPVLWETMAFGAPESIGDAMERFAERDDASAYHDRLVEMLEIVLRGARRAPEPPELPEACGILRDD